MIMLAQIFFFDFLDIFMKKNGTGVKFFLIVYLYHKMESSTPGYYILRLFQKLLNSVDTH